MKECFPDTTGQAHIRTHTDGDSMYKTVQQMGDDSYVTSLPAEQLLAFGSYWQRKSQFCLMTPARLTTCQGRPQSQGCPGNTNGPHGDRGKTGFLKEHGKRWDAEKGGELRRVNMFKLHCMKFSKSSFLILIFNIFEG